MNYSNKKRSIDLDKIGVCDDKRKNYIYIYIYIYIYNVKETIILRNSLISFCCVYIYPTPPSQTGHGTRSTFIWSKTDLNSIFLLLDWLPYQS